MATDRTPHTADGCRTPGRPGAARCRPPAGVALAATVLTALVLGACGGDDVALPEAEAGRATELSAAQGNTLIGSDDEVLVIDVRPVEQYRSGHLVGAQSIDATDPDAWEFRTTVLDRDRPTVVYCSDAACSASAAQLLVDAGFSAVYDLGGIEDWDEGELLVEEPSDHRPLDAENGDGSGSQP